MSAPVHLVTADLKALKAHRCLLPVEWTACRTLTRGPAYCYHLGQYYSRGRDTTLLQALSTSTTPATSHPRPVMVVLPSLPTLARTAAIGGVIVIGSAHYFRGRIQDGIKQTEYYQESLRILRENRGVAYLMGEPIRDGRLDLGDNVNNFCTEKEAQFQVPLKGTKQAGILYLWASRSAGLQPWSVDRLELSVEDQPGKRILLRKELTRAEAPSPVLTYIHNTTTEWKNG
ncbi:uncharacterized protein LOC123501812 isoform X2 [Portunus trituberculatus]|uniref:uncharacterized protein LOC123501812 isoform X2 n=1 Tax=Portunus trituberculatus TaxID=210409 RepID=UPI001E1CFC19|nr:uncharacterized protein LOC123501812 isoform X2 [Portunus trituberculatus]XP_045106765.1 uncharacterized protein LOC123501812 isoform X2 [Portunus trituberculatus]